METWRRQFCLQHHGILGQRWGKRNGPPYPLDASDHSASERKAGWRKSLSNTSEAKKSGQKKSASDDEPHKGLTDKQEKYIKIGAAVAATALVAYGGYKLYQSGKLDSLASIGENKSSLLFSGSAPVKQLTSTKTLSETFESSLQKANPLRGTLEGKNNCVPSGIAGYLRQQGYDVEAKGTGGKMKIMGGVVEECFKGAKVVDGSAVTFGKSKEEAAAMIKRKFGDNAEGLCSIDWLSGSGHTFNWKVVDGKVSFFDYQEGRSEADVSKYWRAINPKGQMTLANLSDAEPIWDALDKYLKGR